MAELAHSVWNYMKNNIEFCALIVSMASAIFAMFTTIITIRQSEKHQNVELESVYFQSIFLEILLEKIPVARSKISFLNDHLSGDAELRNSIRELQKRTAYFRYMDCSFYEALRTELQELEDYIINAGNRNLEQKEQHQFQDTLTNNLASIYKIISDKYHGKNKYSFHMRHRQMI